MDIRALETPLPQAQPPPRRTSPRPAVAVRRARRCRAASRQPLNRRRWANFKANRRGYWSLLDLSRRCSSCRCSPSSSPTTGRSSLSYKGEILFPVLVDYPESKFGGFLAVTDYKDPVILDEIKQQRLGAVAADPLLLRHHQQGLSAAARARTACASAFRRRRPGRRTRRCARRRPTRSRATRRSATATGSALDNQGRDVVARVIYGFRISVLFGLILTILSSVIGVAAGAVQGYFGGRIDLVFQRFLEIWSSIPSLFVLIIISSVLVPGFWTLLGVLLLFQWVDARRRGARRVPARRATSSTSRRRARSGCRTPRSCASTCCPTPWWRR